MKTDNLILQKSKAFAIRIVRLNQYLYDKKIITDIRRQVLRSGTSIGANIKEAVRGQSKSDFYAKINIALKEASETEYWLEILFETGYITDDAFKSMYSDCQELLKILMSISRSQNSECK